MFHRNLVFVLKQLELLHASLRNLSRASSGSRGYRARGRSEGRVAAEVDGNSLTYQELLDEYLLLNEIDAASSLILAVSRLAQREDPQDFHFFRLHYSVLLGTISCVGGRIRCRGGSVARLEGLNGSQLRFLRGGNPPS